MSLMRLIVWSSLIGGWSAFFGWLFTEVVLHRWIHHWYIAILMATLVSVPIGGGICAASGLTNPQILNLIKRLALGLVAGFVGGLLGSLFGSCIFSVVSFIPALTFVGRILGFALIGIGIGAGIGLSEGFVDRSYNKLRNGLLGGVVGGFLGGVMFGIIAFLASSVTSRATAFVLLGLCIGFFVGLVQVVLKEAWLTVEDGFRPGRQMILGSDVVTMGTSEKSSIIFIAFGAKGVEPTHLKITKQPDGRFMLEDNQSRGGTLLNGEKIAQPTMLKDGDAIQFGVNVVRFNERVKHGDGPTTLPPSQVKEAPKPAPPPGAITAAPPPMPAPKPAAPKPAPTPAVSNEPKEGTCPICNKKITGIPGQRRCKQCFTTF